MTMAKMGAISNKHPIKKQESNISLFSEDRDSVDLLDIMSENEKEDEKWEKATHSD